MIHLKKIITTVLLCASMAFGEAKDSELVFDSAVNPNWSNWEQKSYNFGMDIKSVPVPAVFNCPIMTNSTIMVRGQNSLAKRWNYHCFEAYADDDVSRLTMLVNKHVEEKQLVAEIYYYASGYSHNSYNWLRIGSDVRGHSFMFNRDRAIFYGTLELENILTLAQISKADLNPYIFKADADRNYKESIASVKYHALKNAKDGTIFYDKDKKMVVVKIDGKWNKVAVEPLEDYNPCPESISDKPDAADVNRDTKYILAEVISIGRFSSRALILGENYAVLSRNYSECVRFEFCHNVYNKKEFLVYGEFTSKAALENHLKSPQRVAFKKQCANRGMTLQSMSFENSPKDGTDSQLIIAVDFSVPEDRIPDFLSLSKPLVAGSNTEDGVLNYQIYKCADNPDKLFLFERYKSREAHKAHCAESHFVKWNDECKKCAFSRTGKFYDVKIEQ